MTDLRYWLLLQSIEGIGPKTFKLMLDKYGDPKLAFEAAISDLQSIPRISQKSIEQIQTAGKNLDKIDKIMDDLKQRQIQIITIQDENYPQRLNQLSNPPPIIYLWKNINQEKSVAIIGTREASIEGKEKAFAFAGALVKQGYVIVSGYAKGIDTSAHLGAIKSQGKTIAVLPTGILKFAVSEELSEVSEQFLDNAVILSEFFPLSEWSVGNALMRNRITSVLSDKILVIDAGESGGTFNTCEYAKEQSKPIFIYNGIQSAMDSKIIELGAQSIKNPEEIF